jgi:Capsular polysaccharide synthesis protein/Polysaccharide pyruvyl transferase
MQKIIWSCWFQGRDRAPPLVQQCIASWERQNPGWTVRCLDGETARRLTGLDDLIDTRKPTVTAASASDIVRIMLLHEFGGVWVDATTLCNRPLDEWLPGMIESRSFFGFDKPAKTRPIASWFLAAKPGAPIVDRWCRETVDYWQERESSPDYFWFHHLFRDLLTADPEFAAAWDAVPKISADGPHSLQRDDRMYRPLAEVSEAVDWSAPVFKLTHRLKQEWTQDSFIGRLLSRPLPAKPFERSARRPASTDRVTGFAGLGVATDNLGDHLQIIAADRLLARLGHEPQFRVDRDSALADAPPGGDGGKIGLILNGWFKRGNAGWPPHARFSPICVGFHLRPSKSPVLVSDRSLEFLRRVGPVGGRDSFTTELLNERGVEAFESNCLTTLFRRRVSRPQSQVETIVVSRDERLLAAVPAHLGPVTFVNHYTGDTDFEANMRAAVSLIEQYSGRAKLIITTLLHCALPAIAMGIPVVVFYPLNTPEGHASDLERFSSLSTIVPVHDMESTECVDWSPAPVDLGPHKLQLFDRFFELARRWNVEAARAPLQFAPPART